MATAERDFYVVLGVERTATDAEIKRAFRKLAQKWHPDVNTDPAAQEQFKEINEAYQVLSDPDRRSRYDTFGRAGVDGGAGGPAVPGSRGSVASRTSSMRSSVGERVRASARRGRPQPGADLRYDLRITFEEAVKGTEKEIEFTALQTLRDLLRQRRGAGDGADTCPQCNGRGEVRSVRQTMLGQMVNVSACPRCHGEGKIIETRVHHLPGRGTDRAEAHAARHDPGRDRRGPPDPPLERGRGRAARRSAREPVRRGPRPAAQVADARGHGALLRRRPSRSRRRRSGRGSRSRPSRASEEVEVKPGTQPDTEIRLRGKGVPHLRRAGQRGDLHVMIDVVVPTKLSKKARELLTAYAEEVGEPVGHGGGLLEKLGL